MSNAEEMIELALVHLARELVDTAANCLHALEFAMEADYRRPCEGGPDGPWVADDDTSRIVFNRSPADYLEVIGSMRDSLDVAEALTAAILNRSGVSWEAMTRGSRQGIHRRLAARADELFDDAQVPIRAEMSRSDLESARAYIQRWVSRVPDEAALDLKIQQSAAALTALRRVPLWWRQKFYWRR